MTNWPAIQIAGPTVAITTGAAATVPMPQTAQGRNPGLIMLTCEVTKEAFFFPFASTQPTPANASLVQIHGAMGPLIINVRGCDSLRTLQKSAGAIIFVTPLGNQ